MDFIIGKYTIKKYDEMQWKVTEKVKVDLSHHLAKKQGSGESKTKYNDELVGYYPTLFDVKQELGEHFARNSKDLKELDTWVNKLNEIK